MTCYTAKASHFFKILEADVVIKKKVKRRPCLFPFRKRSFPFLTVAAIIGNQAFSHGRSNICSGLMYNKATNTFLKSLRKNKV